MLVSPAFAQDDITTSITAETLVPGTDPVVASAPDTGAILIQNIGMIVLLVVMFYFLLIRPQQKRFKEHKAMVDSLKKGDRVVTGGGLIGQVDTISGNDEVVVDFGNGTKISVLRSMIQAKTNTDEGAAKAKK